MDGYYSRQKAIPYLFPVKVFAENTSRACEVWRFSAKPRSGLTLQGKKGTELPLPPDNDRL
jgi:hypothetical protein